MGWEQATKGQKKTRKLPEKSKQHTGENTKRENKTGGDTKRRKLVVPRTRFELARAFTQLLTGICELLGIDR